MFTANSLSSCLEVLGMSLPYSASIPAVYPGEFGCRDHSSDSLLKAPLARREAAGVPSRCKVHAQLARQGYQALVRSPSPPTSPLTLSRCSDILTKKSFENAIVITNILGGSTNAVLHLLAMARAANIDLVIDDFQKIRDKTPFLANLKPSGQYMMEGWSSPLSFLSDS